MSLLAHELWYFAKPSTVAISAATSALVMVKSGLRLEAAAADAPPTTDATAATAGNAALEDEDPHVFLLALRDVADANLGITKLAEKTGRSRESLYRSLSDKGNPELSDVRSILDSLGYRLAVEALSHHQTIA
jgi:probable addiction module antidote protein